MLSQVLLCPISPVSVLHVAKDIQGLSASTLLSGAVGAAIVFVLTVVYEEVVRTRQRGRELTGLARVIRPEIKRNTEALQ